MNPLLKPWVLDGREALQPWQRVVLSIVVTGVLGFLLEYLGTEVFHAFSNTNPAAIYAATAVWGLVVGPLLVLCRRTSVLIPMAIVGGGFAVLVLLNHYLPIQWELSGSSFVDRGLRTPRIWEFTDGRLFGFSQPLLIALIAGAVESLVVPASILVQWLLTLPLRRQTAPDYDQERSLFQGSVVPLDSLRPKRGLGFLFLRFIFIAYAANLAYVVLGLLVKGRDLPLVKLYSLNPAASVNSLMKLTLMATLANIGAFNAAIRRPIALLLALGHLVSVVTALWLYFAFPLNPLLPEDRPLALASAVGDGLLALLLFGLARGGVPWADQSAQEPETSTTAEVLLRYFFLSFGVLFVIFTVAIVGARGFASPSTEMGAVFGGPDALVINSTTKYGALGILGLTLYLRPGLRRFVVPVLITGFLVSLAGTVVYAFAGSTVIINRLGNPVAVKGYMIRHLILDGTGVLLIYVLTRLRYNLDYRVVSFSSSTAECVMAAHRALRPDTQPVQLSAREVLRRIDEHVVGIQGRRRGLLAFPFWAFEYVITALAWLRPPFSTMSLEEQRYSLRAYALRPLYERARSAIPRLAELAYQLGDIVQAFVTLAFYSCEYGHEEVGYVLPDARKRLQADMPLARPPQGAERVSLPVKRGDPLGLKRPSSPNPPGLLAPGITIPPQAATVPDEVDYCVLGSGAAGAVAAFRLAEKSGSRSICVLERGGYYSSRKDFSDDEMRMLRLLFADGGLQTTRSFDFTILQGDCVGGSTVINNAICVQLPARSRGEWANFGMPIDNLDHHYERVKSELGISTVAAESVNENVERLFRKGILSLNRDRPAEQRVSDPERLEANVSNCFGCGLCNIGCRRERKLSMLETYLPWAQARGVKVSGGMEVLRIETEANQSVRRKATKVVVRREDGAIYEVRVRRAVVLTAGALSSSRILLQSGLGGQYVGTHLACNFAIPPLAEFEENVDAYDGLQMALFAAPENFDAIFETTFNPPGMHAIALPLYFARHHQMMAAYRRSVNFTALVGSDPLGALSKKRDFLFGRGIDWNLSPGDIQHIRNALITLLRIGKGAGATQMYLPTHPVLKVPLDSRLDQIIADMANVLTESRHFNLVTAHPQGGNRMAEGSFADRVVDADFRVRDCENVYVCDASVFPAGARVNPQWTIMALASMAGEQIAAA